MKILIQDAPDVPILAKCYKWTLPYTFKTQLHIAIDDATGQIVGAYFDEQETLNGYYHVLHQVLSNYGIPYQFFTDNRTVFEYQKKHQTSIEKDTFTQFGYTCKQLGIDIRTSSVAQAKGRVERMFGTLQSRLSVELRLENVTSIQQANQFLHSTAPKKKYIPPMSHPWKQASFEKYAKGQRHRKEIA